VNARKLASAIRLLAPVILALADAVEEDGVAPSNSNGPSKMPERKPRGPRIPEGVVVTDTDRKAAERAAAGKPQQAD